MPGTGVSDLPLASDAAQPDLVAKVLAFVDRAKAASSGGLTVAEFGELLFELLRLAMSGVAAMEVPGTDKKAFVMSSVAALFDAIADSCVPTYLVPVWWIAKPVIRTLVLALIGGTSAGGQPSGAVEALLPKG
jgi:hypothetical protein